jgi:C4-dicarboxylate-specific signal transduction histidine kinase
MDNYERRMNAIRAGEYIPPASDAYDANADLRALESQHRRKDSQRESYLSREQLEELRRVQNERIQAGRMKILGMDIKQNMGVRMDGTAFDE